MISNPLALAGVMGFTIAYVIVSVFKIVWWIAASWLLAGFVRAVLVFKRQPMETRFFQNLCAELIYIGGVLGMVADVFDLPVSGLLAASGVIAIVLGLALRSTLGDVFSGVVLKLSKPYWPGDWIVLDTGQVGGPEGRVTETNWRATQFITRSNDVASIPNSIIFKARLVNASAPARRMASSSPPGSSPWPHPRAASWCSRRRC